MKKRNEGTNLRQLCQLDDLKKVVGDGFSLRQEGAYCVGIHPETGFKICLPLVYPVSEDGNPLELEIQLSEREFRQVTGSLRLASKDIRSVKLLAGYYNSGTFWVNAGRLPTHMAVLVIFKDGRSESQMRAATTGFKKEAKLVDGWERLETRDQYGYGLYVAQTPRFLWNLLKPAGINSVSWGLQHHGRQVGTMPQREAAVL